MIDAMRGLRRQDEHYSLGIIFWDLFKRCIKFPQILLRALQAKGETRTLRCPQDLTPRALWPPTLILPLEGERCEKIGRRAQKVLDIVI
jgi:hypothetical protein